MKKKVCVYLSQVATSFRFLVWGICLNGSVMRHLLSNLGSEHTFAAYLDELTR